MDSEVIIRINLFLSVSSSNDTSESDLFIWSTLSLIIKNFLRFTGIDWSDNSAISCSFWLISNETDGLFKLSLNPCCHTKKVMTIEIKARVSFDLEVFLKPE